MLDLSDVTLLCVDTRAPDVATWAMGKCLEHARFAKAVLLTDLARVGTRREEIQYEQAPVLRNVNDYSRFMLTGIGSHVVGSHVLIVQWDGFIVHPDMWDPQFLGYDYIGAVWPQFPDTPVGNGGFSLRSRRLLDALSDPGINPRPPEDKCICVRNRDLLEQRGIRFAPPEVASRFSVERLPWRKAFGFHGFFNFPSVLSTDELRSFVRAMPASCCGNVDAYDLVDRLWQDGEGATAAMLTEKLRFRWKLWSRYGRSWLRARPWQKRSDL